jgi:deazaflavin-dependent oxidoreductase (nitroreductase family)
VPRHLLRAPVLFYRAHLGWLLGQRFLMLTHVGRRTGREYRTVLEVVGVLPASGEYVVMSGFGRSADWFRNVMAGGGRLVTVGRHQFSPEVRELGEDESAALICRYERRHRLATPLLRGLLSRLVGWRYTGTDDARCRLVRELPLLALRPAGRPRAGDAVEQLRRPTSVAAQRGHSGSTPAASAVPRRGERTASV